jgi:ribosomal protein S9
MNNSEGQNTYIVLYFSECLRKTARGEVTIRSPGTGLITINNQSIEYFEHLQDREQVGCTVLPHSLLWASKEDCQVSVICWNVLRSKDPSFYQLNSCI